MVWWCVSEPSLDKTESRKGVWTTFNVDWGPVDDASEPEPDAEVESPKADGGGRRYDVGISSASLGRDADPSHEVLLAELEEADGSFRLGPTTMSITSELST